ncbi:hypothetical protein C3Y87_04450 [Carbonactinospora thermoautotrophica]|nr:hypothetical protein [Carbonactinospora thermoautotrophica]
MRKTLRPVLPVPGRWAARLGPTVRAAARPTPHTLRLIRRHAQPTAVFITRLTVTAVLAYLVALWLPGSPRPLLAPLTALLVVQFTLYQTLRHAAQRVASVVAGVLVAVAFSTHVGFTWWSLGVTIAAALTLGHLLRLGDHILEVPISAMLVLSLDGHTATGRVVETLLGAAVGLLAGLVASPVHVQPAGEAVQDLARQMAALLDRMADELTTQVPLQTTTDWLTQARRLGQEIHRVDRALTQAEESLRLNPRGLRLPHASLALRSGLDTLEHAAGIIRVLTRSFTERAAQLGENEPMYPPQAGEHLTRALRELAAAVRAYGKVVPAELGQEPEPADRELEHHLTAARQARERLTELLRSDPAIPPTDWLLHCEVLVHLNQLFDELCLQRRTQTRQHYHRRRHPTTPIRLTHKLRRPRPPHRPTPHPAHSGTH